MKSIAREEASLSISQAGIIVAGFDSQDQRSLIRKLEQTQRETKPSSHNYLEALVTVLKEFKVECVKSQAFAKAKQTYSLAAEKRGAEPATGAAEPAGAFNTQAFTHQTGTVKCQICVLVDAAKSLTHFTRQCFLLPQYNLKSLPAKICRVCLEVKGAKCNRGECHLIFNQWKEKEMDVRCKQCVESGSPSVNFRLCVHHFRGEHLAPGGAPRGRGRGGQRGGRGRGGRGRVAGGRGPEGGGGPAVGPAAGAAAAPVPAAPGPVGPPAVPQPQGGAPRQVDAPAHHTDMASSMAPVYRTSLTLDNMESQGAFQHAETVLISGKSGATYVGVVLADSHNTFTLVHTENDHIKQDLDFTPPGGGKLVQGVRIMTVQGASSPMDLQTRTIRIKCPETTLLKNSGHEEIQCFYHSVPRLNKTYRPRPKAFEEVAKEKGLEFSPDLPAHPQVFILSGTSSAQLSPLQVQDKESMQINHKRLYLWKSRISGKLMVSGAVDKDDYSIPMLKTNLEDEDEDEEETTFEAAVIEEDNGSSFDCLKTNLQLEELKEMFQELAGETVGGPKHDDIICGEITIPEEEVEGDVVPVTTDSKFEDTTTNLRSAPEPRKAIQCYDGMVSLHPVDPAVKNKYPPLPRATNAAPSKKDSESQVILQSQEKLRDLMLKREIENIEKELSLKGLLNQDCTCNPIAVKLRQEEDLQNKIAQSRLRWEWKSRKDKKGSFHYKRPFQKRNFSLLPTNRRVAQMHSERILSLFEKNPSIAAEVEWRLRQQAWEGILESVDHLKARHNVTEVDIQQGKYKESWHGIVLALSRSSSTPCRLCQSPAIRGRTDGRPAPSFNDATFVPHSLLPKIKKVHSSFRLSVAVTTSDISAMFMSIGSSLDSALASQLLMKRTADGYPSMLPSTTGPWFSFAFTGMGFGQADSGGIAVYAKIQSCIKYLEHYPEGEDKLSEEDVQEVKAVLQEGYMDDDISTVNREHLEKHLGKVHPQLGLEALEDQGVLSQMAKEISLRRGKNLAKVLSFSNFKVKTFHSTVTGVAEELNEMLLQLKGEEVVADYPRPHLADVLRETESLLHKKPPDRPFEKQENNWKPVKKGGKVTYKKPNDLLENLQTLSVKQEEEKMFKVLGLKMNNRLIMPGCSTLNLGGRLKGMKQKIHDTSNTKEFIAWLKQRGWKLSKAQCASLAAAGWDTSGVHFGAFNFAARLQFRTLVQQLPTLPWSSYIPEDHINNWITLADHFFTFASQAVPRLILDVHRAAEITILSIGDHSSLYGRCSLTYVVCFNRKTRKIKGGLLQMRTQLNQVTQTLSVPAGEIAALRMDSIGMLEAVKALESAGYGRQVVSKLIGGDNQAAISMVKSLSSIFTTRIANLVSATQVDLHQAKLDLPSIKFVDQKQIKKLGYIFPADLGSKAAPEAPIDQMMEAIRDGGGFLFDPPSDQAMQESQVLEKHWETEGILVPSPRVAKMPGLAAKFLIKADAEEAGEGTELLSLTVLIEEANKSLKNSTDDFPTLTHLIRRREPYSVFFITGLILRQSRKWLEKTRKSITEKKLQSPKWIPIQEPMEKETGPQECWSEDKSLVRNKHVDYGHISCDANNLTCQQKPCKVHRSVIIRSYTLSEREAMVKEGREFIFSLSTASIHGEVKKFFRKYLVVHSILKTGRVYRALSRPQRHALDRMITTSSERLISTALSPMGEELLKKAHLQAGHLTSVQKPIHLLMKEGFLLLRANQFLTKWMESGCQGCIQERAKAGAKTNTMPQGPSEQISYKMDLPTSHNVIFADVSGPYTVEQVTVEGKKPDLYKMYTLLFVDGSTRNTDILVLSNLSSQEFANATVQYFQLRGGASMLYLDNQSAFEPFKTEGEDRWSYEEGQEDKEQIKTRERFKEWVTEKGHLEQGNLKVTIRCSTNHKLQSLVERAVSRQKRYLRDMVKSTGVPDTVDFIRRCQEISNFSNERVLWIGEDGTCISPNDFRIAQAERSGLPAGLLPSGTSPASTKAIEEIAERTRKHWRIMAEDTVKEHLIYRSREDKHPELKNKLMINDIVLVQDYFIGSKGRTGKSFKQSLFQVEGYSPGKREVQLWHYQTGKYFGEENAERKKTGEPLMKGKKITIQRPADACILVVPAAERREHEPIDIDISVEKFPPHTDVKYEGKSPFQTVLELQRKEENADKQDKPIDERLTVRDGNKAIEEITDIVRPTKETEKKKKK